MENETPTPDNKSYFEKFAHPDYFMKRHPANIMLLLFILIFIGLALILSPYLIALFNSGKTTQSTQKAQTKIAPTRVTNETTNWKTYTSTQFEFQYPIDQYSVVSGPTNIDYAYPGQLIIQPNDSYIKSVGSNIYTLTITPIINKTHLTLQTVDTLLGVDNSKNQFPPKDITIGGVQGVRYDKVPGQVDRTEIYILKQDKSYPDGIIYNFTLRTLSGAEPSLENVLMWQKGISTFKFTN